MKRLRFTAEAESDIDAAYGWYLTQLLPRAGRLVSRHGDAYRYLPRSIAAYPDAPEVSTLLRSAGLEGVRVMRMSLGIVTIHVAERPRRR